MMYKLQCKTCKRTIKVDREIWHRFENSLNGLPKPFNSSALVMLDKISNCCNNPDYWEVTQVNED